MKVDRAEVGSVTVLRLEGDLDENGVDELRGALYGCITDGRLKIVLALNEVRFISYMGVGVMVERLRKLRSLGGDIKLSGVNLYAQRLFRMVGVTSLFDAYECETQAIGVYQEAA
ncbi:MAG TPA: STAS domain-containing protein [Candidatus Hydrogenedentes bacterium]|nr:STAS domain-containing protein [Candidatus Hydrogenedentota bacterium]HOS02134.1 STAS domain-containing protein [Candidatus Hydrogenedentota bacterium]